MPLSPITGHHQARRSFAIAVRSGRLPQVLLLSGPTGIGKQRLALWLGQLALCEQPGEGPCGTCRACRLVDGLAHADLHWFVPIPRPKSADGDKQLEEAAESIAGVIAERRSKPLYAPADGMAGHSMASVRLLLRRASLTSVEGGRRVFIIGEAERLVLQESSPEAANALLKLLEEPPAGSLFILTAVDPRRLLPTMRSRAAGVRLHRLANEEVRDFLRSEIRPALTADQLEERVALAAGAIGDALAQGDDVGKAFRSARNLLDAVLAGTGPTLERALQQPPYAARGEFAAMLDALADTLGEAARGTMGQPVRRSLPEAFSRHTSPASFLRAMERVDLAREAAAGNVNPQILLAVLGEELAEVL